MPIYEYRCSACGFEKDALQKMSDAPLVDCPSCGKPALVKLISAAGFHLKGSGWYATDFKSSGKKPSAEKSETSKPESATTESGTSGESKSGESKSGDAKSTESKPATSAEPSKPTPNAAPGD